MLEFVAVAIFIAVAFYSVVLIGYFALAVILAERHFRKMGPFAD